MKITSTQTGTVCAHCGEPCDSHDIHIEDRSFCCTGCQAVYTLLHNNDLEGYYSIEKAPGRRPGDSVEADRFAYLDDPEIRDRLLDFADNRIARVTFSLPQIHCSACVWLLENLHRLDNGIRECRVDFARRQATVVFCPELISLRRIVELLASIGYEPEITLSRLDAARPDTSFRSLYIKVAVAGFCFGNVMLLSFPEYLGLDSILKPQWGAVFNYLNLLLALPVFFYGASDFFRTAWNGLRHRQINMDVPISLGIGILFFRSVYSVIWMGQAGYIDSLCALVFLLLIGRVYQKKTYISLSFDRDFGAYFPIAIMRLRDGHRESVGINRLQPGDRIIIRNRELVPADSILIEGRARLDYSFVTGESEPVAVTCGQKIFAGARQQGGSLLLDVIKKPSHSYLMQLWTQTREAVEHQAHMASLANRLSHYFTPTVILIALATAVYWLPIDSVRALNAATAVLIVACPCALALSTPFALGTMQRLFGRSGFYLKDSDVIERMAGLTSILFDKTGTITRAGEITPEFVGKRLTASQLHSIVSLAGQSTHPLSTAIASLGTETRTLSVTSFLEVPGMGLEGIVDGQAVKLGSAGWIGFSEQDASLQNTRVYAAIDGIMLGYFRFGNSFRKGLRAVVASLEHRYSLALLSGDSNREDVRIKEIFGSNVGRYFGQSPQDKLAYINRAMLSGKKVLMVGDGLNDAGALLAATTGVTVVEENATFSPACDGILNAGSFHHLPAYLNLARDSVRLIKISFGISFLYNIIGLSFAVQGVLSPVVAAILMPASSLSVVLFATMSSIFIARRRGIV